MFSCAHCHSSFAKKFNLQRHITKLHAEDSNSRRSSRILCCICNLNFTGFGRYHDHLKNYHHEEISTESKKFRNIEEFQEWKANFEKETTSTFVQTSSAKKLKNKSLVYHFYCHRSFLGKSNKKKTKNREKHSGTNKINSSCPAVIKARVINETVLVEFCSTHLGHECDITRLRLTTEQRNFLAGQLSAGVPPKQILIELRQEAPKQLDRIHYVKRSDLHNIKKAYGITCPLQYDNVNSVDVESWIQERENLGQDSPLSFYENQTSIFQPITEQNNVTIHQRVDENLITNKPENCKRAIVMTKLSLASAAVEKELSRLNDMQLTKIINLLNSIISVVNEPISIRTSESVLY